MLVLVLALALVVLVLVYVTMVPSPNLLTINTYLITIAVAISLKSAVIGTDSSESMTQSDYFLTAVEHIWSSMFKTQSESIDATTAGSNTITSASVSEARFVSCMTNTPSPCPLTLVQVPRTDHSTVYYSPHWAHHLHDFMSTHERT